MAAAGRPVLTLVLLPPLALPQPVPDSGNGFAFSVYYPEFVQQPLEQYIETSHGGMVQPSLALGGNASHPVLITQDFSSHPLRSLDGGLTWSPLCATTTTAAAGERAEITPWSGRPAGIGLLPDGTLLLGTVHSSKEWRRPLLLRPFRTVTEPAPGLLAPLSGFLTSRRRKQRKNGEKMRKNGRDTAI